MAPGHRGGVARACLTGSPKLESAERGREGRSAMAPCRSASLRAAIAAILSILVLASCAARRSLMASFEERMRSRDCIDAKRTATIRGEQEWLSRVEGGVLHKSDHLRAEPRGGATPRGAAVPRLQLRGRKPLLRRDDDPGRLLGRGLRERPRSRALIPGRGRGRSKAPHRPVADESRHVHFRRHRARSTRGAARRSTVANPLPART